jgi:hypothetical protein
MKDNHKQTILIAIAAFLIGILFNLGYVYSNADLKIAENSVRVGYKPKSDLLIEEPSQAEVDLENAASAVTFVTPQELLRLQESVQPSVTDNYDDIQGNDYSYDTGIDTYHFYHIGKEVLKVDRAVKVGQQYGYEVSHNGMTRFMVCADAKTYPNAKSVAVSLKPVANSAGYMETEYVIEPVIPVVSE